MFRGLSLPTLHVHLDESGDYSFTPRGSRYYVLAVTWTYTPTPLAADLSALRFQLIKAGYPRDGRDLVAFHARNDPAPRRDAVIGVLLNHSGWNFAAIVIDKPRVNPVLCEPEVFYPKFAASVLKFVFRGRMRLGTTQVLVYTDTLPMTGKRAAAVEGMIKTTCANELIVPFQSSHHSDASNMWIQATDYCAWAIGKKWESGDVTDYNKLRPRLAAPELAPMALGDGTTYYER